MSKFRFRVCQDYTRSVMVIVDAETIQEAHEKACDSPDDYADKGFGGTLVAWRTDDLNRERPYIPDESDYEIVDANWNARNQHPDFTHEKWVTEIRMYRTEKGYHDWVVSQLPLETPEVLPEIPPPEVPKRLQGDGLVVVECINEPRGEHGLEGYQCGYQYMALLMTEGKHRYAIYPVEGQDYYETCSVKTFNKYFKEVK